VGAAQRNPPFFPPHSVEASFHGRIERPYSARVGRKASANDVTLSRGTQRGQDGDPTPYHRSAAPRRKTVNQV